MDELKRYLELSEQVRKDAALMKIIDEYHEKSQALVTLLQDEAYDAAEAIRLTNDVEYLSGCISKNALYQQYFDAKESMEKALLERAVMTMPCDCNCSTCHSDCEHRENV